MSRPLEQALAGLIPSHNGPLPPELTTMASSLLAQSRSKASSLKPEEEIARTYACAHLACERLKQRLNLPAIQPRPPVAPRTYRKVYDYFENALRGSAANTPASAGRRRRAVVEADKDAAGRGRATPRSRAAVTGATGAKDFGGEPPEWIMPLIRTLCKTLDAPAAVPHVYAGLRSVLRLTSSSSSLPSSGTRGRPTREAARAKSGGGGGVAEGDIAALVVALVFFVSVRMAGRATGKAEHDARRNKAAAVLMDGGYANGVDDKALAKQIDDMVARAGEQKWVDETQEQRRRSSAAAGGGDKNASTPLKQSRADSSSLRGGLGTMMQESVDYLSEEKRRDYKVWRAKIMKQVEAIEKEDMAKSKGKSRAGG
ncbi:origin recognition complex subunit 6-domain-containing protein [Phyllosticta paracitricarpa]